MNVDKRITYEFKLPKVNSKVQEKNYKNNKDKRQEYFWQEKLLIWEFDPGSGWTLAACLTHASRTKFFESLLLKNLVADGWVTRG